MAETVDWRLIQETDVGPPRLSDDRYRYRLPVGVDRERPSTALNSPPRGGRLESLLGGRGGDVEDVGRYHAAHSEVRRAMDKLDRLSRAIDALNRVIGRATVWLILASIVISAGNAVMRKLFGLASNFWLEGQWHLYAAAFLCAGGYVLLVDEHVRVDVLSQHFGPRLRAWLDLAVLLVVVLPTCVLLIGLGSRLALSSWRIGESSWHPGGPLHWPVLACIPLGFGLLGLQALSEVIKRAGLLLGRREKASLVETDLPEFFGSAATRKASP
jgi:TRAP-type mannitol/chloroaromatic compound transport system permease small subunit